MKLGRFLSGNRGRLAAIGSFFAIKVAIGAAIVLGSARVLGVNDFAAFSQFFLLSGYLMLLSSGGAVNGVIQRVAAAQGDCAGEASVLRAALMLWAGANGLALMASLLFPSSISRFLVSDERFAAAILPLAMLLSIGGMGQLFAAVLTGRGRISLSLGFQGVGVAIGGFGAFVLLLARMPIAAVLAFAAGPVFATILAAAGVRDLFVRVRYVPGRQDLRYLLGHSTAFTAVAAIPPAAIFWIRAQYQDAFDLTALGFWLAANRISDISSQLIGLYLAQIFLPAASGKPLADHARRHAVLTAVAGMALFALPLAGFLIAPDFWVRIFLARHSCPRSHSLPDIWPGTS